jgi:DHA1 family multidrug resistance protein-like MFS transporter
VVTRYHSSLANIQTFAENILHRRADRLRRLTGNSNIRSPAEFSSPVSGGAGLGQLVREAIFRPIQMTFWEPIIIAVNLYIGKSSYIPVHPTY